MPTLSYPLQQHPVLPPQPPDASIGARSSHRASLACELQRPLEPTRRGCGAGLAPRRGRRSPTGGRRRGGPWGRLAAAVARTAQPGAGREAARNPGPPLAQGLGGSEMGISDGFGTEEEGPDPSVGWNRASSDDKITSRAALLSAVPTLTLETLNGASKRQDRDGPQTPGSPIEDSPCPTCSSSSESEPEGFFFGQRLPEPWKTPENLKDTFLGASHCPAPTG